MYYEDRFPTSSSLLSTVSTSDKGLNTICSSKQATTADPGSSASQSLLTAATQSPVQNYKAFYNVEAITPIVTSANLSVAAVDRGIHAALCIFHQVLRTWQPGCQTYNLYKQIMPKSCKGTIGKEGMRWMKDEKECTKIVRLSCNVSGNMCRYRSDVGKGWIDQPLVKVLWCHLVCQSFRCFNRSEGQK